MIKILFILILLCGCARTPVKIAPQVIKPQSERQKILATFKKEDQLIILAFEKEYGDTFDIARNFNQYKKEDDTPTYDKFYIWLSKNLWYIDLYKEDIYAYGTQTVEDILKIRYSDKEYIRIRKNYELFNEMYLKGQLDFRFYDDLQLKEE